MRVAVIADDLTGAADAGVQFARAGHRTAVAFAGAPLPPAADLDAWWPTRTRACSAPKRRPRAYGRWRAR